MLVYFVFLSYTRLHVAWHSPDTRHKYRSGIKVLKYVCLLEKMRNKCNAMASPTCGTSAFIRVVSTVISSVTQSVDVDTVAVITGKLPDGTRYCNIQQHGETIGPTQTFPRT
jgi:hypothetical protein